MVHIGFGHLVVGVHIGFGHVVVGVQCTGSEYSSKPGEFIVSCSYDRTRLIVLDVYLAQ